MKVMRVATMLEGSHATKADDVITRQRDEWRAMHAQLRSTLSFSIDKFRTGIMLDGKQRAGSYRLKVS